MGCCATPEYENRPGSGVARAIFHPAVGAWRGPTWKNALVQSASGTLQNATFVNLLPPPDSNPPCFTMNFPARELALILRESGTLMATKHSPMVSEEELSLKMDRRTLAQQECEIRYLRNRLNKLTGGAEVRTHGDSPPKRGGAKPLAA